MFDHRVSEDALLSYRERFERIYERTYPKPRPQTSRVVRFALAMIVLASVIVSTSHTIPAFLETIDSESASSLGSMTLAIAALVMVEFAMLAFAYLHTRLRGEASRERVMRNLRRGLMLSFALAVGANFYSVLGPRFEQFALWDVAAFAVLATVAFSAPTLAYITGEVVGMLGAIETRELSDALDEYEQRKRDAWDEQSKKFVRTSRRDSDVAVVERAVAAIPEHVVEQTQQRSTDDRTALERALDHLRATPEDLRRSPRDVAVEIGVGKDTLYKARAKVLSEKNQ